MAWLEGLPEEFAPQEFQVALNELPKDTIPQWQIEAAFASAERTRKEVASPLSEAKARFEAWADTLE